MATLTFLFRIYELAEIVYFEKWFELEPFIHAASAVALLSLASIDIFTVYKEVKYNKCSNTLQNFMFNLKILLWFLNSIPHMQLHINIPKYFRVCRDIRFCNKGTILFMSY